MQAIEFKFKLLAATVLRQEDPEGTVKLEMPINEIDEATFQTTFEPAIHIDENKKTQYYNEWPTHCDPVARLEKQIRQDFSMMRGQCPQILMDKINYNPI